MSKINKSEQTAPGQATRCVHTGTITEHGINSPVYASSAFPYHPDQANVYPRYYNTANQEAVVQKICALEEAEAGLLFSSGMSAISSVILGLLQAGDHIILQRDLYGGTMSFVTTELPRFGIAYTLIEEVTEASLREALQPETRLIYLETPSNPLLHITDLSMVSRFARANQVHTMIDNTFASPINQQPVKLGIDIVIHSGTKYLGGHSDLIFGVAVSTRAIMQPILKYSINSGGNINAQTCALIERSLKTLAVRVKQQNTNARALAEYLHSLPEIKQVNYPGLARGNERNYRLATEQMNGYGGMLSFELADALAPELMNFLGNLKLATHALSLGGVETLVCIPARTSHIKMTAEERAAAGISDQLVRVSVGIEEVDDITEDFRQALAVLEPSKV